MNREQLVGETFHFQ